MSASVIDGHRNLGAQTVALRGNYQISNSQIQINLTCSYKLISNRSGGLARAMFLRQAQVAFSIFPSVALRQRGAVAVQVKLSRPERRSCRTHSWSGKADSRP